MRSGWIALVVGAGLVTAACQGPARPAAVPATPATAADPAGAAQSSVDLVVPPGEGGGAFSMPRRLEVPDRWTARVWARVPGARMEAWTPEGDLLVSEPGSGRVVKLTPRSGGTPVSRILLSGLTSPRGLAFARRGGRWVLYVGESDQIDRYPWGPGGISGTRTVIAARLPDLDPAGDDVHREKDVAVAPDGTVYFDVGSSANARPGDRTSSPPRAAVMAVSPHGHERRGGDSGGAQRRGPGGGPRRLGVDRGERARQRGLPVPLVLCRERRRLRAGHPGLRQRPSARRGRPGHRRAGPGLAVLQPRPG